MLCFHTVQRRLSGWFGPRPEASATKKKFHSRWACPSVCCSRYLLYLIYNLTSPATWIPGAYPEPTRHTRFRLENAPRPCQQPSSPQSSARCRPRRPGCPAVQAASRNGQCSTPSHRLPSSSAKSVVFSCLIFSQHSRSHTVPAMPQTALPRIVSFTLPRLLSTPIRSWA